MQEKRPDQVELGWLAAFALLGMFFVFAVTQFPAIGQMACKVDEEDCLRQWVSALGGWAALGAAIPTIYFLAKQITASTRQQRVIFAISIRSDTALVRTAKLAAEEMLQQANNAESLLNEDELSEAERFRRLLAAMEVLADYLRRPAFSEFEIRIAPASNVTVTTLAMFSQNHIEAARRQLPIIVGGGTVDLGKKILENMRVVAYAKRYAIDTIDAAATYERDVFDHYRTFD